MGTEEVYLASRLAGFGLTLIAALSVSAQSTPPAPVFSKDVYPALQKAGCAGCHSQDGVASGTRLLFPEADASPAAIDKFGRSLQILVNRADPDKSLLL